MTGEIVFTKAEALGNDFIIIGDGLTKPELTADDVVRLCDRKRGIGADGVLLIVPSERASFGMRILNADGSEAETCGNGLRCAAVYAYERGLAIGPELDIETAAGKSTAFLTKDEQGNIKDVRVDLGSPMFNKTAIEGYDATCLSIGNPHAVIFVASAAEAPVGKVGPEIARLPQFPDRTNVEFVQVIDRENITVRVWERGAGETEACGTGAAASLAASAKKGLTERKATVGLRGGRLDVEWAADAHLYIKGEARLVFEGKINRRSLTG
ncbi:MAG: diaminopimelate epimerase [Actinomycetota bacterium]